MNTRARMVVTGVVQGVGFRYACQLAAEELDLRGWVRNLDDGGVEIVAEGAPAAVKRLAAWARLGPPGARVRECRVVMEPPAGTEDSFAVRF